MPLPTESAFWTNAGRLGIPLTGENLKAFRRYQDFLIAENRRVNLTAISTPEGVQNKHFLDSLTALPLLPTDACVRMIDVGAGAGFPGVPLKMVRPGLRLTLLEATRKKVDFLQRLVRELDLADVNVVWARAETLAHDPAHRERYDVAVARAVAPLPALLELLLPFCRLGGQCIVWKGPRVENELSAAGGAMAILGGRLRERHTVALPGDPAVRHLVVVDKAAGTPLLYPRRPGIPAKHPLR